MWILRNGKLTGLRFVGDVGRCVEPVTAHGEGFLFPGLRGEGRCCLAAQHCDVVLASVGECCALCACSCVPAAAAAAAAGLGARTFEARLDLHYLRLLRVFHPERGVDVKVLFDYVEEVVALFVEYFFAA